MSKTNGLVLIIFLIVLTLFFIANPVLAFQGNSSSYSVNSKFDVITGSQANTTSSSFVERFIGGFQPVANTTSSNYSGRLGILEETSDLAINLTSPQQDGEIVRGNDAVANEDDLGLVSNSINLTARVYEVGGNGISGVTCYFYFDDTLIDSAITNSTGYCNATFDKSTQTAGIHSLYANYTYSSEDYSGVVNKSNNNISLTRFVTPNFAGNKSVATQYVNGQVAILYFNITKINSTGTIFYDPLNISINATTSAGVLYPDSAYVTGYRIFRSSTGVYQSKVIVNQSLSSFIRWSIILSDNNFSSPIGSALQADIQIGTSACGNAMKETSEQCDDGNLNAGDGCSATCTTESGGTTTASCFPEYTLVSMSDGSKKQIKDVKVGDEVLSYNTTSGEISTARVTELESPFREGIYEIKGIVNGKIVEILNVTDEHPLYTKKTDGRVGWAAINKTHANLDSKIKEEVLDLDIGDSILNEDENWIEIYSINYFIGEIHTYNLKKVDTYNNFFVNGLLAHNKEGGGGPPPTCNQNWVCSQWSICESGLQTRSCDDVNKCGSTSEKPDELQSCAQWICGEWGVCGPVNAYNGPLPSQTSLPLINSISKMLREVLD